MFWIRFALSMEGVAQVMAWEQRRSCRSQYYYRSVRVGGRVIKQYVGKFSDALVQLIAKKEQLDRSIHLAAMNDARAEQCGYEQLRPLLRHTENEVQSWVQIYLLANGLSRKEDRIVKLEKGRIESPRSSGMPPVDQITREHFDELVALAKRGDCEAATHLRQIVRERRDIWEPIGNLTRHVEAALIELIGREDQLLKESLVAKANDLRSSLDGESKDVLCQLMVDHLVLTWLEIQFVKMAAIQQTSNSQASRFWDIRHEKANARYVAAIKELALIQKAADVTLDRA